tara:strand:+ start:1248 stop:1820 length:573 start_codon:yes stop_codon:yes gene_type:complete
MIYINGKQRLVHVIIARAFLGEQPEGYQVDHINGDKADNRPENLRWASRSQNLRGARRTHGRSKYRGVSMNGKKWSAIVLHDRYGSFDTEEEAAERFDDVAFYEHNFPLEGLNFPQRILDKMAASDTDNGMIDKTPDNTSENIERIQTQIEMIRQESRILSYRIERMMEQRKGLSEEKRKLKEQLETLSV